MVTHHELRGYDSPDRWYEVRYGRKKLGEGSQQNVIKAAQEHAAKLASPPSILDLMGGENGFTIKPIVRPDKGEGSSDLERQFLRFDEFNPHVYEMIVKIASALRERGFKRAGMKMIFERMRWLWAMQTKGEDYKLNNNYTAFYARKVMADNPDLKGLFKTRAQKHKKDIDTVG